MSAPRPRFRLIALGAGLAIGSIGCANLVAKKVPVEKRIDGCDTHMKGFRYYLNRPYFVVTDRVPIATRKTLVWVDNSDLNYPKVSFPDQTGAATKPVPLEDLKTENAGSGAFRSVTSAELERIKKVVSAQHDAQVVQLSASRTNPELASQQAGGTPLELLQGGTLQFPAGTKLELPAGECASRTAAPGSRAVHSGRWRSGDGRPRRFASLSGQGGTAGTPISAPTGDAGYNSIVDADANGPDRAAGSDRSHSSDLPARLRRAICRQEQKPSRQVSVFALFQRRFDAQRSSRKP